MSDPIVIAGPARTSIGGGVCFGPTIAERLASAVLDRGSLR